MERDIEALIGDGSNGHRVEFFRNETGHPVCRATLDVVIESGGKTVRDALTTVLTRANQSLQRDGTHDLSKVL